MNISGSDVSKEAANMILLGSFSSHPNVLHFLTANPDDNFASTVSKYCPNDLS